MALTSLQWYTKIKSFLPEWFFQQEVLSKGHLMGLATVFATLQADSEASVAETFILQADGAFIDAQGAERTIPRLSGETDNHYAVRVRNIANQSNVPALQGMVSQLLVNGSARIQEDFNSVSFASRGAFANRAALFLSNPIYNCFTVVVNKQIHPPYSFLSRGNFASRGDFMGTYVSSDAVFASILQAVNDAKGFGIFYRIIELSGS